MVEMGIARPASDLHCCKGQITNIKQSQAHICQIKWNTYTEDLQITWTANKLQ